MADAATQCIVLSQAMSTAMPMYHCGPWPGAHVPQLCARELGEGEGVVGRVELLSVRSSATLAHRLVGGGEGEVGHEERGEEEDAEGLRQRVVRLEVGGRQAHERLLVEHALERLGAEHDEQHLGVRVRVRVRGRGDN
eukprot:scaffold130217_cov63-Phaeocystis_antarctica.AAC.2